MDKIPYLIFFSLLFIGFSHVLIRLLSRPAYSWTIRHNRLYVRDTAATMNYSRTAVKVGRLYMIFSFLSLAAGAAWKLAQYL